MERTTVKVDVASTADGKPSADGLDRIDILIAPNRGEEPKPMQRIASGGELSRVMLGLEVVLGAVDPVPTFVFDEVDAGVGGSAALGIGREASKRPATSEP